MRLSSDFWCSALLRQVRNSGAYAYLTRRGAAESGAVFILLRLPLGLVNLYGPAPQSFYAPDSDKIDINERYFIKILSETEESVAIEKLEKEIRFDADLWLLEIEDYKNETLPFAVITL